VLRDKLGDVVTRRAGITVAARPQQRPPAAQGWRADPQRQRLLRRGLRRATQRRLAGIGDGAGTASTTAPRSIPAATTTGLRTAKATSTVAGGLPVPSGGKGGQAPVSQLRSRVTGGGGKGGQFRPLCGGVTGRGLPGPIHGSRGACDAI